MYSSPKMKHVDEFVSLSEQLWRNWAFITCSLINHLQWMNEWCIYITFYCVLLYTQSALQSCVCVYTVSPQPPPVCSIHLDDATATTGQRRQCAHHTPATGGEERVIEPIKWMGIIRRPWLTRASGGNLVQDTGLHPYSLREVPWDFNDHRESGPLFNISSERQCFLTV